MRSIFYILISLIFASQLVFAQQHREGRIIYVSKKGNDQNDGSKSRPYLTISKAAASAAPGVKVLIGSGTYRESVVLSTGGKASTARITFAATEKGKVLLKGSDQVKNWVNVKDGVWKAKIDASDNSNVFYLDGKRLAATSTNDQGERFITLNFGRINPNQHLVERAVRKIGISVSPAVNYVAISGIDISHVFTEPGSIYGAQNGAITVNGGKGWLIEQCTIHDCSSIGIAIGVQGHAYENANFQQPEFSDLSDIKKTGQHVIRNNHIYRCGQAGIFGLLGGSGSEISNNLITDINTENGTSSLESAGIRLAVAIDVQVKHNTIRNIRGTHGVGMFLGPLFQGARISGNVISETTGPLIYLFKNHGPVLFDNNVLFQKNRTDSGIDMLSAEANVFVQNLFYNCSFSNQVERGKTSSTANYLPHSLVIKQTIPALNIDQRWWSNLFIGKGLDFNKCAGCEIDYNMYINGAQSLKWADENSIQLAKKITASLTSSTTGSTLKMDYRKLPSIRIPLLDAKLFGFFTLSKQYIETPSGAPITVEHDFFERISKSTLKVPGPFYNTSGASASFILKSQLN